MGSACQRGLDGGRSGVHHEVSMFVSVPLFLIVEVTMRRWVRRGLPLVAGIVLGVAGTTLGSIAASSPGPAARPQSLIVSTGAGQIEGRTTGTVDQFLGVPYAAPPAGALRWQPPQPVTPRTGG